MVPDATFAFTYEAEERILCTKGRAVITPTDEPLGTTVYSALCENGTVLQPIELGPGDSAVLMEGFACQWQILEPMEYRWVYTDSVITHGWSHVWCASEEELSTTRGRVQYSQRQLS